MTTNFCAGVVGDKQHIEVGRVGGSHAKLVPPASDLASTPQFPGHQAHRRGALARLATELKVDSPDLFEGKNVKPGCWIASITSFEWLQIRRRHCDGGVDGLLACRSLNTNVRDHVLLLTGDVAADRIGQTATSLWFHHGYTTP
jgi:hypothetical protein